MIKERIIQLIEYKSIAKEKFYEKIGVTSANFRGNAKKTPLNSNTIENILSEIPDLNLEWLLTGKGEMLKSSAKIGLSQKIIGDSNLMAGNNTSIVATSFEQFKKLEIELQKCKKLQQVKDLEIERQKKQIDKLFNMIN